MLKTGTRARLNIKRGLWSATLCFQKNHTALCLFIHWHMNAQRTQQHTAASYKVWKIWRAFHSFFFSLPLFPLCLFPLAPRVSPSFHLPLSLHCESMARQLRSFVTWEADWRLLTFKQRDREETLVHTELLPGALLLTGGYCNQTHSFGWNRNLHSPRSPCFGSRNGFR